MGTLFPLRILFLLSQFQRPSWLGSFEFMVPQDLSSLLMTLDSYIIFAGTKSLARHYFGNEYRVPPSDGRTIRGFEEMLGAATSLFCG